MKHLVHQRNINAFFFVCVFTELHRVCCTFLDLMMTTLC